MTAPDLTGLRPWLDAVTTKYGPLIHRIHLAGSRAAGHHRPDSDWDVLLVLRPALYASDAAAIAAEQEIATCQDLPRPAQVVDLFFLLPGGRLRRWEKCADCGPSHLIHGWAGGLCRTINGLVEGPAGDFTRFLEDWPDPPVIWPLDESDGQHHD